MAALSLAEHYGQGLMQIKDISSQNNIPVQYLAQIFSQLVKSEIIKSVRGKNGGYELARPPAKITVFEILELLEGGFELSSENIHDDTLNVLLSTAAAKLKEVFQITLADLLSQREAQKNIIHFDI